MANVAKLKKRALEFEQKKQFDKALETYGHILRNLDEPVSEADIALYNRVGDLLMRRGNVAAALDHYEKAVDLYAESGFFNNALALCKKVLRNAPGRASMYYKLGKISAKSGFANDAKQNFLEYADRMQQAGDLEEAFRALKEFADLCPDQDDIRLMLADQLVRKDRKPEAIEQLQRLYEKLQAEGRTTEARATLDRMKAIDPTAQPRESTSAPSARSTDLVFLDVNYDAPLTNGVAAPAPPAPPARPASWTPAPAPVDDRASGPVAPLPPAATPLGGAEPIAAGAADDLLGGAAVDDAIGPTDEMAPAGQIDGLITGFDDVLLPVDETESASPVLDVDSLSLGGALEPDAPMGELQGAVAPDDDRLEVIHGELTLDDLPMLDVEAHEDQSIGGELSLILPDDATGEFDIAGTDVGNVPGGGDAGFAWEPPAAFQGLSHSLAEPAPLPPVRATDRLRQAVAQDSQNWHLRRQLAEALFEEGDRSGGLRELEAAMLGMERAGDLAGARSMAEELIRVEPNSVEHHQKRVEYAVRSSDRLRLVDAYRDLAEALFRMGELDKSRVVYGRVLELAPNDERVRSALATLGQVAPPPASQAPVAEDEPAQEPRPAPPVPPRNVRRSAPTPARPVRRRQPSVTPNGVPPVSASVGDDAFVDLAEWLREEEAPKSTRMVVDVKEPAHDEQVDFAEMLAMFKEGVEANVDETDHESHYDLGVAYKEMGLLDEAISEFQKALRGTEHRVRTYEALGQCFVEKGQYQIAVAILTRALGDKQSTDDLLVGVLYLLGYASEMLKRWADAQRYYERVFAVDIQFRDIGKRLAAVERAGK